jgi:HAD superfamily hydrolase (TIGR01509 family)
VFKALIFDVDGTLVDTERQGHRVAFNRAFAEARLNWVWDEALYGELLTVAGGKERIRHFIASYHPEIPCGEGELSQFIENLHAAKTRHYIDLLNREGIPARPGIIRLIKEARAAGLRLAIATTASAENVEALLAASLDTDAPDWFEVIAAGDIVSNKKPASDIYEYVLTKLGLKAEDCLAFEDSENGLRASLGAGIPTLITVNDYTSGQDFTGAVLVIDHLGEPEQPLTCLSEAPSEAFSLVDIDVLRRLFERWTREKP